MNDLHVLLLQTAPVWNDPDASIAAAAELLQKAETDGLLDGIDLIVLPEMWTTGFNVHEHALLEEAHRGPGQRAMQKWAEQWNCGVLGSLAVQTAEGQRHNRMFFVEPDGNGLHYDKRHLFTPGGESRSFVPGSTRTVVPWRGWNMLLQVCYDLRFPESSRNAPDNPYDLVVYAACWPAIRIQAWDILLQARAIENAAFSVGLNAVMAAREPGGNSYPGHSSIYNYLGECLGAAEKCTPSYCRARLDKTALQDYRTSFPVLQDMR